VLLASHFGNPHAPGIPAAAVVCELTHLGTLYHDDVMDEATIRRGTESANSRWGNTIAILTGDFLSPAPRNLLADLGPECVRFRPAPSSGCAPVRSGRRGPGEHDDPLEHYMQVVADKTGALIATSARFGSMLAGATSTWSTS